MLGAFCLLGTFVLAGGGLDMHIVVFGGCCLFMLSFALLMVFCMASLFAVGCGAQSSSTSLSLARICLFVVNIWIGGLTGKKSTVSQSLYPFVDGM